MASPDKLGRRIATLLAGDGVKPIRAYHGSPHNFDRFDASKIGTGEGAQAYGHGLYFAQNPHVAEQYREELSAGLVRLTPSEKVQILWRYHEKPGSGDVKSTVRDVLAMDQERLGIDNRAAIEYLESLPAGFVPPPPAPPPRLGRVYEVELGVPEEALLDWDSPVGAQSDAVQSSMRAILGYAAPDSTGQQVYRTVVAPGDRLGVTRGVMDLRQGGIPGIRYLDGQSRSAGQGTRNYVMFPGTEDHIRILRKYGLLAPMALPALQEGE
jgi:hypothetical protein